MSGQGNDRYQFRTAPLLNIELTAPYGHLGQYDDLRSMVLHYTDTQQFLQNYSILNNVTDTDLTDTLLANTVDIRTRISNRVRNPRNFDVDAVVAFLQSLTADSARDLSALMPATVPSSLSVR